MEEAAEDAEVVQAIEGGDAIRGVPQEGLEEGLVAGGDLAEDLSASGPSGGRVEIERRSSGGRVEVEWRLV